MLLNLLSVFRRDAGAQTETELVEARTPCGVPSSLERNYVRCQPTPQVTKRHAKSAYYVTDLSPYSG